MMNGVEHQVRTHAIVEFIEARLAEDELWAKAASAGLDPAHGTVGGGVHWAWAIGPNWEHYRPDPAEQYLAENVDDRGGTHLVTVEKWPTGYGDLAHSVLDTDDLVRTSDAAHIARHDPARALRAAAATRRLVEEIIRWECGEEAESGCGHDREAVIAGRCPRLSADDMDGLRLIASTWVDHVDFQPRWSSV